MDSVQEINIKKQRNAKIQRDKRRKPGHKTDSDKSVRQCDPENVSNSDTAPQPQRTNRRQGNESTPKHNSAAEVTSKETTGEVKETIVIDHSNLKRETEEIAKLTKKFSRREIMSNWHRYSAQTDPRAEQSENEVPADFTDLLQVPVSRGGHLQLKEEQGWSSVTPGGLWALDLKLLSFSLACIPTHERLRLPQDKLSKEEIQRYTSLAEEAKRYYNAGEGADLDDDISCKEKPFSILDVERSTNLLLNMNIGEEISSDNISNNITILEKPDSSLSKEKTDSNLSNEVKSNFREKKHVEEYPEPLQINKLLNFKELDSNYEKNILEEALPENNKHNHFKSEVAPEDKEDDRSVAKTQPLVEKHLDKIEKNLTSNQPWSQEKVTDSKTNNILISNDEINTAPTVTYEIKDKRPNRTKSRNSPMKEEVGNKTLDKVNDIQLEDDDDDLDFLLSLKKPVPAQKENKSKAETLKDSSFLPGGTVTPSTTLVQRSDLDDWLDSVLQD